MDLSIRSDKPFAISSDVIEQYQAQNIKCLNINMVDGHLNFNFDHEGTYHSYIFKKNVNNGTITIDWCEDGLLEKSRTVKGINKIIDVLGYDSFATSLYLSLRTYW